ncbi:response regulator [Mastigocoleus sp. MO_188.B34]|uniref:hybrid sensor histidine kinase/response regulator n=1 Tax=Mastigocoleus sp. MO_188.B34 TaxID=3036635 RepID=UPI00261229F1|nr:response regulator [Mastigocoleus sp. MO_188.B34]MDJ0697190.1 response regulator [Mastigocoleus sp. MO_188.B34]
MQVRETGTILIVDDQPTNLSILSRSLQRNGMTVMLAINGQDAIKKVLNQKPELILLDIQMPGIDGFETCNLLKQNTTTQDIPIIFMTASIDSKDKIKGLSVGAVDYITKPFEEEEVLARVRVHLKLSNLTKTLEHKNFLLEELTKDLEERVAQRTNQLSQALEDLQNTQMQLIQTEKMSALGQLVAGVAHEINNPLSFIAGNIEHTEDYVQNLIEHLRLYQHEYPEVASLIENHAQQIELNYLLEDLPQIIDSMKTGAERIYNISTSLRSFSRSDTTNKVYFDIHEGIDSTLLILRHRLKANERRPNIEVKKDYGDLPLINCFPSQLNQVFMNIIANAIDAFDEINNGRSYSEIQNNPNLINITTRFIQEHQVVTISIEDNGPGIPDEIKKNVFKHLFTTKTMGKGTGLGLSISRQIVEEKHEGKLKCISLPGKGAKFVIGLPLK